MKEEFKNNIWIPKSEQAFWENQAKEFEKFQEKLIWGLGNDPADPREDENVKYAWVQIAGERKMIGVDNKTLKGYVMVPREGGGPHTWKLPLEEQKYDTFIRWCTTFDM